MRTLNPLLFVLALAACTPSQPALQGPSPIGDTGSAERGRAYAEEACATCHAVTPDGRTSPNPDAPAFAELATTPGMTGMSLNVWLHSEHDQMPHLMIDSAHVDDLWAYMSTLRAHDEGNH